MFEDLCAGLTQPCQCQASARRMIKTVQVCIAHSSELAKYFLCVYLREDMSFMSSFSVSSVNRSSGGPFHEHLEDAINQK